MRNQRLLGIVSLAAALGLVTSPTPTALADNVVADDQIVQGQLCVGTPCADGEVFDGAFTEIKIKGGAPAIRFEDTITPQTWFTGPTGPNTFQISGGSAVVGIVADGKMGVGTFFPSQMLHVRKDQNANIFSLVQNAQNTPGAAAVVRTQADTAIQNFQSHASSRTLVRWGVPLGGWNEFLSFVGNGLAMGTFGNAPFILGTSASPRMTFDGDSNVIDFGGGGQYNGNSFLDASSRTLKQDIRPLASTAAAEALAGLEPVTFAYRGAPGDARVGFVAEDVPELVATPGRQSLSALEIVAVLTKVVQEQQKAMQEQRRVLQEALAELTARLSALEARP